MHLFNYPVKPMLPTLTETIPKRSNWVYEPKYDGYRAQLIWSKTNQPRLYSRGLKDLSSTFPDIIEYAIEQEHMFCPHLPLVLDGELCVLEDTFKASFHAIQKRGNSRNAEVVQTLSQEIPAVFIAFDVLHSKDSLHGLPFSQRRSVLETVVNSTLESTSQTHYAKIIKTLSCKDHQTLWHTIEKQNGEGIVAKKTDSLWTSGKRTKEWLKIKNPRSALFILTGLNKENGYFHVSILKEGKLHEAGSFSHGLKAEEREALQKIIFSNQIKETAEMIYIKPGICLELSFLEWSRQQLRQPRFKAFRFDAHWEECTWHSSHH